MEQLNRIELRGMVGIARVQAFSGKRVLRFTVATNYAYKSQNGDAVIDTEWHNVNVWEGRALEDVDSIQKGDKVYVCGRLKYTKFIGQDGQEHNSTEIQASKVLRFDDDDMQIPCSM
ncbi:MAG: single-stranded DNA-binding protein [Bacteroidales bacterium]|nr:single-stranded DNA-binding protein [Bacteroidales bacterium]